MNVANKQNPLAVVAHQFHTRKETTMTTNIKGEIIRETDKYIYTRETLQYNREQWFLGCHAGKSTYGLPIRESIGCTVYDSEEDAKNHIRETACLFNWPENLIYTFRQDYPTVEVKHHRYKK